MRVLHLQPDCLVKGLCFCKKLIFKNLSSRHLHFFIPLLFIAFHVNGSNPGSGFISDPVFGVPVMEACDNATFGGLIQGDEFGCPNPTWDPSPITNVALPTGGTGTLQYLWIFTTNDPSTPLAQWTPIPNSNSPNYDPGPISVTTYYRRCARRSGCTQYVAESNIVAKEAICCDNVTDGGQIGNDQVGCLSPFDPAPLVNVVSPSGGSNALEYQWVVSTTGTPYTPGNPDWTPIASANAATFDPGPVSQKTFFIRLSRRHGCLDYNGVSNMVTITVSTPVSAGAIATPVTCLGGSDGAIDLTVGGGTAPYQYNWNPTLGNVQDPQGLTAGIYLVTITDANGCTGQASVEVTDGISLSPAVDWTNETCMGAGNGTATVTSAGGGVPGYTYQWSAASAGNTATISGLTFGNYTVTVTDANGCTGQTSFTVGSGNQLDIELNFTQESCQGANNGTAEVITVTGGTPGFNYQWSFQGTGNTASVSGLPPGSHSVTVTDANGCMGMSDFNIDAGAPLVPALSLTHESCLGANNGIATVTSVTGGAPGYMYQWSYPGAGTAATANGFPAGSHSVTVTNSIGCFGEADFTINAGVPLSLGLDWTNESCLGANNGTATVTNVVNGTPGYTYSWSFALAGNTQTITDLPPNNYSVTVTDALGCSATGSLSVAGGAELQVSASATAALCFGGNEGTATVTAVSGGSGNYSYQWNDPALQTTQTATGLNADTYTVFVNDDQGCVGTAMATVVDGVPIVLNTTHTDATCGSSADGTATVLASGGTSPYSYLWSDANSQTNAAATSLPAGAYTVTVTDVNGCTATATETVESPMGAVIQLTSTATSCFAGNDGSVAVTVTNDDPSNYFYQWNTPGSNTTQQVNGLSAGTYTVTVSDGNGCFVTGSATVQQPSALVLDMQSDSATCVNGSDGIAEVFVSGGTPFPGGDYAYVWDAPGNPQVQVLDDVSPGTYTVTVTDANGCTATGSVQIGAPAGLNIALNTADVSCSGFNNGSATANVTGGVLPYTYLWDDFSGSTTPAIADLGPGVYGLTVTDANGCSMTSSATIFEPPALALIIQKADVICVNDTNGSATANVSGGVSPYTYQWAGGQTSAQISGLSTGTYSVTVTDANGCTTSGSVQIVSTTTLAVSAVPTPASCFSANNGSVQANVTGGAAPFTYTWSNGSSAALNGSLTAGTYTVTVTDANGCTVTASATVTSPPQLTCSSQVVSSVTTFNGSNGSVSASAAGGAGNFTFNWSNGSTLSTVSNLSPGAYTVTVTDGNGCTCTSVVTLINPSKIGNFVWNDLNGNGLQDTGEPGVEGVTVRLIGTNSSGNQINLVTTTNASGNYFFDGLNAGTYQVKVSPPTLHVFTQANAGNDDTIDSDFNPADSLTSVFALAQGVYDSKWDAGLVELDEKTNIGDFVWEDVDRNGLQGVNEQGIAGISVKLFKMPGSVLVASTTTNQFGKYLFTDVMPGNYFIEFSLSTLPNGYIFAPQNVGNNDNIDSDPNPANGRTDVFSVFAFTADNLSIDAGIFKECDNVTDGGLAGYDENLCGIGADPAEIVNIALPTGGFGTLEYLWLYSHVPIYNGPGDPNWTPIPNSNSPNYNPGPIGQSTYYIRCSRRQGCVDYPGETNVIAKTITQNPLTQIIQQPNTLCVNEGGTFAAAIAGGGATYEWDFGPGAVPQTAATRVVNGVYWTTAGVKTVKLTVTRFGCSSSVTGTVQVNGCTNPILIIDDLTATLQGQHVEIKWNVNGDASNSIFFVQRSEDGVQFDNLTALAGEPGAETSGYQFIDSSPRLGENIYRIKYRKMGDPVVEGFSGMASIFHQPEGVRVATVYPNPTFGRVTVELIKADESPVQVQLWNGFGKVLETFEMPPFTEKTELDLNGYSQGVYWFRIKQKGYREQVLKVVKVE